MAIGFGPTDGVGSTDRISTGLVGQSTQRTYAFRCKHNTTGGAGFGRVISTDGLAEYIAMLGGGIGFSRMWSGTQYQWIVNGTNGVGTTYSIVIQYDSSSTANNVVAWVNGVSASIGNPAARTGTPDTDINPYRIGNRGDQLRNFDGWISSVAIWNELIPANMAQLISGSYSPLIYLPNLIYYNPMIRDSIDVAGGKTQTTTGTVAIPHPPILRESGGGFVQDGFIAKTKTKRMIFEGSSTIVGFGLTDPRSQSFPAQSAALLGSGWETHNFGVSGTGFTQMISRSVQTTHWMRDSNKTKDVVFCLTGANDLGSGGLTAAQTWAACQTWTNAMKAKGFKVVLSTLFAQNLSGVEAKRSEYNALVRAGWASIADGLADFASDPIIGNPDNWNNTTYYQGDTVHLTEKGAKDCLLPYFLSSLATV